ncbi:MAG TPA: ATP-binding cassette domain-containing protein [Acidisoma sp.]|jgi:ABC-type sugar transport system ATPase subunit|nr:ATP-binding cassette domain-containing protein [Acidisoma sp.]
MLTISAVSKRYGETVALDGVSIDCAAGSIHTILGENGSGKSTLVKLLSGVVQPDHGRITVMGAAFTARDPAGAQTAGIATVFQEVLVAPDRSVADNVLLGLDGLWRRRVPRRDRSRLVEQTFRRFTASPMPLDAPAGDLPLAAQQLVVLARAVLRQPRILILDEITAALDFTDRESVFAFMEQLAAEGLLLLFITHRMDEVMRLSSRISVLRSGRHVQTLSPHDTTPDALLALMAPEISEAAHHG